MEVPFISSGAMSRAHYAIVRSVESAGSSSQADQLLLSEVRTIERRLVKGVVSMKQTKEFLVILLYCFMTATPGFFHNEALEFALPHALNLTEASKATEDRRIGYLFCSEVMSVEHELRLMLVNTLRKDLESTSIPRICLALDNLISSSNEDVIPAVLPRIQELLSHKYPHIRRRALLAMRALSRHDPELLTRFGSRLANDLLDTELPVASAALIVALELPSTDSRMPQVKSAIEGLVQSIFGEVEMPDSFVLRTLHSLRLLGVSDDLVPAALDLVHRYSGTKSTAVLLEAFRLFEKVEAETLNLAQTTHGLSIIESIRNFLTSRNPNDQYFFLSCLECLDPAVWAGSRPDRPCVLETWEVERVMQILNSPDALMRMKTLRLLDKIDHNIIAMHYSQTIQTVPTELTLKGQTGYISRLLEIIEVESGDNGEQYGLQVKELLARLEERGTVNSQVVFESAVEAVLLHIRTSQTHFRLSCATMLLTALSETDVVLGSTLMVIVAALGAETCGTISVSAPALLSGLAARLGTCAPTVQDVCVLAMLKISASCEHVPPDVTASVSSVRQVAGRYLQRHCDQFLALCNERPVLGEIVRNARSPSLPDFVEALNGFKSGTLSDTSQRPSFQSPPPKVSLGSSKLRYTAYELPSPIAGDVGLQGHSFPERVNDFESGLRPGDLALAAGSQEVLVMAESQALVDRRAKEREMMPPGGKNLITLDEAKGDDNPDDSPELKFERLWDTIGDAGGARGWCNMSVDGVVEALQELDEYRVQVISGDKQPFKGELKVTMDGAMSVSGLLRLGASEDGSCLWRLRPISRPSSPAPRPDSAQGMAFERPTGPLNRLSLSNFRRSSPSPYPLPNTTLTPLVQDGSYLEMLSLKLSEAVSRALAQPNSSLLPNEQLGGRRPIPQGRGHALGSLIASELNAAHDSPHLYRAILRCLHRPLSVLVTNLSAHLLPLLISPAFQSPPAPTIQAPNPNPTQLHALAIANFSGELLAIFDELGLGTDIDVRGDGLRSIRDSLVSFINRVTAPLVAGIRHELMPIFEALEIPHTGIKSQVALKTSTTYHPSIVTLQSLMPIYARALVSYTTCSHSHAALATLLISVVWKGLVALSHRALVLVTPPPSPHLASALTPKKRRSSPSTTPPITPPAHRFTKKLPPSRPPSPPAALSHSTIAADARALYDLLNLLPRPNGKRESSHLAQEAVNDAFDGLRALQPLFENVQNLVDTEKDVESTASELEQLTSELPLLIALPILLRAYGSSGLLSVASLLGLSEDEYRKGCLSGFGRAEECATAVVNRVMEVLRLDPEANAIVLRWLEMEIAELEEIGQ